LEPRLPTLVGDLLRVLVGLAGVAVLLLAATTAISGFARLTHSLGEHRMLPAAFGRLHNRTLVSPRSLVAVVLIVSGLLIGSASIHGHSLHGQATLLAGFYSFGVLIAFSAVQLAVIRLRFSDPGRYRPFRVPLSIRLRGADLPLPAVLGLASTLFVFVLVLVTHVAARYGGPLWLAAGLVVFGVVRRRRGTGLLEQVVPGDEEELPQARFARILVPMKLGEISEEMMATAVRIAQDKNASVIALSVIPVPLEYELDAELGEVANRADAALEEAKLLAAEHEVPVTTLTVRTRAIGPAIVEQARELAADLIIVGSGPRWQRQSRFFSPTVEYVLRLAPCQVMIVSFPEGTLEPPVEEQPPAST
jgi:APA family basic amino acid/polyamine antiporter